MYDDDTDARSILDMLAFVVQPDKAVGLQV